MARIRLSLVLIALLPLFIAGCDSNDPGDDPEVEEDELATFRTLAECDDIGEISLDETVTDALSDSDCTLGDGTFIDYYAFRLTTAEPIQIELESEAFDAYLWLITAAGTVVADDDDGGTDTNARLAGQLSPGLYVIAANSVEEGEVGDYTLRFSTLE